MAWVVRISTKAQKGLRPLPEVVRRTLALLLEDIADTGPVRGDWPNYGKLGPDRHHCHLKKGKPTYVAVWVEEHGKIKVIEVTYVGTHEKAPY
ncbi:MAG: cytotoxic translational repressor of toxin-antitoxin stability system [Desulfovibrio sp.]|jgi:mRNA-degrading endonuclease RelE of RelBE toxin-antitoxin system|nr:cytotoxic translational repressor of toxin-antitoxin stability system [Desulfovibrio sp.]